MQVFLENLLYCYALCRSDDVEVLECGVVAAVACPKPLQDSSKVVVGRLEIDNIL